MAIELWVKAPALTEVDGKAQFGRLPLAAGLHVL
jgi:hypothetical protein